MLNKSKLEPSQGQTVPGCVRILGVHSAFTSILLHIKTSKCFKCSDGETELFIQLPRIIPAAEHYVFMFFRRSSTYLTQKTEADFEVKNKLFLRGTSRHGPAWSPHCLHILYYNSKDRSSFNTLNYTPHYCHFLSFSSFIGN